LAPSIPDMFILEEVETSERRILFAARKGLNVLENVREILSFDLQQSQGSQTSRLWSPGI